MLQAYRTLRGLQDALTGEDAHMHAKGRAMHSAVALINQVLVSLELRCRANLRQVTVRCLDACLPPLLAKACKEVLQNRPNILASPSTLQRSRFVFDLAFMRMTALKRSPDMDVSCYGWEDFSPQVKKDWLLSQFQCIDNARIIEVFRSVCQLNVDSQARAERILQGHASDHADDDDDDDDVEAGLSHVERVELSLALVEHIHLHSQVPVALASGRTGVVDKAEAYAWSHLMECQDTQTLSHFMSCFVGQCTDMGVEMGIAGVRTPRAENLLPESLNPGELVDDMSDGASVAGAVGMNS
jgi:hypothetical protein